MQIKPDEITSILKSRIEGLEDGGADLSEVGTVLSVADGISRVHGLDNVMSSELLELPHDVTGLALNLESDNVGAVLFGPWDEIEEGDEVKRTGRLLQVPVGDELLGRIVDPLGRPLDGKGDINTDETRPAEFKAPGVVHRQPVKEPMQTGIKPIDAMTNVGRGQRELIIGDRQTGKTSICIDTIINNKDKDLKCVYVAVGQRMSTVVEVAQQLDDHGALDNTVIVAAPADEAAPIKFLAPYAGAAIAEHWLYNEQHSLAVYDDLTKHAYAYRQMSLLLRRPPGREAYPGDVFYLHSRLLERSVKLSDELGAGSFTALPIIETQAGDVSAYIPTNVISITDGQIFLEADLFRSGVRPAINVGISVSRVGGSAQTTPMRKVAGRLRLELSQYRELEAFAQFGSDLDADTQATLNRGARLVEVLKQDERDPWSIEDQVAAIYAGTGGYLDRIKAERVQEFLQFLLDRLHAESADLMGKIAEGEWSDEIESALGDCIAEGIDDFGPDFDEEGNPLEEGESDRIKSEEEREKEARTEEGRKASAEDEGEDESDGDEEQEQEQEEQEQEQRRPRPRARVANLKDIRGRIASVKNIRKITRAMEMISAARLRKAEQRIEALRPYADALRRMTARAAQAAENIPNLPILQEKDEVKTVGVLLITGDRGLAGPFNSQILRAGNQRMRELRSDGKEVLWYAVGRRGVSSLEFRQFEVGASWTGFTDRPSFADARAVADGLAAAYVDGNVDRVEVFYNGYISPVNQEVRHETLLPLQQADVIGGDDDEDDGAENGDGRTARSTSTTARSGSTNPTPRRSSPGWCRTTWRSPSTGRCSSPPHRSTGLA